MLAVGFGDSEVFSTIESDSNDEHNVHSNYHSSHDTPNGLEDDELDHIPTSKPEITNPDRTNRLAQIKKRRREFQHHHLSHQKNRRSEFRRRQTNNRKITKNDQ